MSKLPRPNKWVIAAMYLIGFGLLCYSFLAGVSPLWQDRLGKLAGVFCFTGAIFYIWVEVTRDRSTDGTRT